MQTTEQRHDPVAVTAALRREYELLDSCLAALRPERWAGPSAAAEWNVQKVVSHLGSGAEITLRTLQQELDGAAPLTAESRQEVWDHFDSLAPAPLFAAFEERNQAHLGYLEALAPEQRARRLRFFAGEAPVGEYSQYRLSELALHSWDIRVALDPTARLLPDTTRTLLPLMLQTLPRRANADARARLAGTAYAFVLAGAVRCELAVAVQAESVAVEQAWFGGPVATLWLPAEAFIRLLAGRLPLPVAEQAGELVVEGDGTAARALNELFPGY